MPGTRHHRADDLSGGEVSAGVRAAILDHDETVWVGEMKDRKLAVGDGDEPATADGTFFNSG